jgi:hypothetical protein
MQKSESIAKVSMALVKAQSLIGDAKKNAQNPHLKNRYANLGSVWDAISPALETSKLAVIQLPSPSDDGKLHLTTILIHESGEYIGDTLVMPLPKQDPQGYGSALTYGRRYGLCSLLGVVQDDDDGSAATANVTHSVDMINSVSSMEELQKVFSDEYKKFDKNSPEMRVLVDAKDAKKVSLTPAFNPAVLNNNHEIKKQPEEVKVAAAKIDDF